MRVISHTPSRKHQRVSTFTDHSRIMGIQYGTTGRVAAFRKQESAGRTIFFNICAHLTFKSLN